MKSALAFDARVGAPRRVPFAPLGDRYSIVGKLRSRGRAEVSIGLPVAARSSDELVVIKAYAHEARRGDEGAVIPPEIDVASAPRHDNLVRIFECGWDAERHFIVSEYLEGTTLRRLLRWLAAHDEKLPDAAVARILLGLFAAVEHATQWAGSAPARALVHRPIDASDVFVSYAGEVKVLGFKPRRPRNAAATSELAVEPAAVDELLSTQRSAALGAALARIGNRVSAASLIGLWQVARMLKEWQSTELRSDGLTELAEVMAKVQPEGRAARRQQLDVAVARVVRARDEAALDAAPVSGYRVVGSGAPSIVRPEPVRREASAVAPALIVLGADAVSHLQGVRPLPPPLPPAFAAQRAPLASAPTPRPRNVPWARLVLLAGALMAALVVARHRGERAEPTLSAPAALAPESPSTPAEPGALPASRAVASTPAVASEPSAARARDNAHPKHAGAPARTTPPPASAPASSAAPYGPPRASRAGSTSIARAIAPAVAPGFLTLDTTPWSAVSVGGTPLGQTPLVKVELPPGQHLLELANDELGIATSIVVEITSGATTARRIGLERPIHAARQ